MIPGDDFPMVAPGWHWENDEWTWCGRDLFARALIAEVLFGWLR